MEGLLSTGLPRLAYEDLEFKLGLKCRNVVGRLVLILDISYWGSSTFIPRVNTGERGGGARTAGHWPYTSGLSILLNI